MRSCLLFSSIYLRIELHVTTIGYRFHAGQYVYNKHNTFHYFTKDIQELIYGI